MPVPPALRCPGAALGWAHIGLEPSRAEENRAEQSRADPSLLCQQPPLPAELFPRMVTRPQRWQSRCQLVLKAEFSAAEGIRVVRTSRRGCTGRALSAGPGGTGAARAQGADRNRFWGPECPHTVGLHSCSMFGAGLASCARRGMGEPQSIPQLAPLGCPHPGKICSKSFWSGTGSWRGSVPRAAPLPLAAGRVIRTGVKSGARPRWERWGNADKAGLFPLLRGEERGRKDT